jgi:hypothetical protein
MRGKLLLSWADNLEPDFNFYEVRDQDSGWGDGNRLYAGKVSSVQVDPAALGVEKIFYIKAVDQSGNYSPVATTISYTVAAPLNPTAITEVFADTSLTNATITLNWDDVDPVFGLDYYEVSYNSTVKNVKANTITLPADWLGSRVFTIKTVDALGNKSSGLQKSITKLAPNSPTNFRAQVVDNTVSLSWTIPTKTTLPIDHFYLKKGSTWATATEIGSKSGAFTTVTENLGGTYTYWIASVDTDNNESSSVSLTADVADPPDFTFFGSFNSTFSGTYSSAFLENGSVILPVNTAETWASHFTSRSWTSPQDQIDAGYPVYIQPNNSPGYYEEIFDYGSILSSSKITMSYTGATIAGTVTITPKISISSNGSSYTDYDGFDSIYGVNFRYVKIRLTASGTATAIYQLNNLSLRLDSKLLNDAGSVSALSTDTNGTIVNFNKEFVDVSSITATPSGTTSTSVSYEFNDNNLTSTYSITSNVCTVTYTAHGLITGQNIRFQVSSGGGVNGVYTITGYTANTFTVAMTAANTTGNCIIYPESFRIYLFNSSGTRVSASASWNVKGY